MILTIHATNIHGLGASQVVSSFLLGLDRIESPYSEIICYVPASGMLADTLPALKKIRLIPFHRRGPKGVSRVIECLLPARYFRLGGHLLVLGDVPLRTRQKQIVFIQQSHLLKPSVNSFAGRSITYRAMRTLTHWNASFVRKVIVQTAAMKDGLSSSYPDWASGSSIEVIGQPPPFWFKSAVREKDRTKRENGLKLFYPASGTPHKNHKLLEELSHRKLEPEFIERMVVTIKGKDFNFERAPWLELVGHLNHEGCLREYSQADALIYPSLLESYGLPLVEAMVSGLPVVASDLPYAHSLCGDNGIYFDPESVESLHTALNELKSKLESGWKPDWSSQLSTLPKSWEEVATLFLEEFSKIE